MKRISLIKFIMKRDLKIKKYIFKDLQKIRNIYLNSFSKENRFCFLILVLNLFLRRAEIYVVKDKKEVLAFLYLIKYKSQRFILYLAVREEKRNQKIGSYLLNWYLDNYKNYDIYLNIDEVNLKFKDYLVRKKRLDFYLRNGFYLTNYLAVNKENIGNILYSKKVFSVDSYERLDKKISKWLFCKRDNIVKVR